TEKDGLKNLDLREADLYQVDLRGLPAIQIVYLLNLAHLEAIEIGNSLDKALQDVNEFYLKSQGTSIERFIMNSIFLDAHLEGANLFEAHLDGLNIPSAHLEGANLSAAHLMGTRLQSANLAYANLSKAHLEGANLSEAYLE